MTSQICLHGLNTCLGQKGYSVLKEELTDLEQEAMIKRAEVNYTLVDVKKDKYGNYN